MRHIIAFSGGKDSAALGIYLKNKNPHIPYEFVMTDSGKELPETYEYIQRIEKAIRQSIYKICGNAFDEYLERFGNFLPSAQARWCTKELKIRPFEAYLGKDECTIYMGIRADEDRGGNYGIRKNVIYQYPFKEDGLEYKDILNILNCSRVGLPDYMNWRTRSGCYFCFFQRIKEWRGLLFYHPNLYWKAAAYEKDGFTWRQGKSLKELSKKFLVDGKPSIQTDIDFGDEMEGEPCLICSL